jgi:large subunit ribosomal protein L23
MSIIGNTTKGISVIIRPRVTEKAGLSMQAKAPVYVFEVTPVATKDMIAKEIFARYKVKPTRVNIVNLPKKTLVMRGIKGSKPGVRKAMVFLKAGEKIDIV